MRPHSLGIAAALVACTLGAGRAGAQTLRGTIRDSASAQPVAGAVVVVLDSADATLARGLTNERGAYRVALSPGARRVRLLRIGFRPQTARIAARADADADATLDVRLAALPTLLAAVRVEDAPNCPRRADRATAFALWEQARTGLLATVVARETAPASLKLLLYERTLDGAGDRVVRQRVRIDSSVASGSFAAVGHADDFVAHGFVRADGDDVTFLGPDADVLLDPAFATHYCFHVHAPDAARPGEMGLGFTPAARRDGRVDIDGTLWVDTAARVVRTIDFRYVGLGAPVEAQVHPGGRIDFHAMPNGVVMIDRWALHVPAAVEDERGSQSLRQVARTRVAAHDIGGEVARADWEDGAHWQASLGTLRATVVDAHGRPVHHAAIRLVDTDYLGTPDVRGTLEIRDLLPGPYTASVIDTALARLGIAVGIAGQIVAERDSVTSARLLARTVESFVGASCREKDAHPGIAGMVFAPDGTPATDARWELGESFGTVAEVVAISGRVDAEGRFAICPAIPPERSRDLQLRVWRESAPQSVEVRAITSRPVRMTITLPRR